MSALPDEVIQAWEKREGPVVLTTVDSEGVPNSIYATCVGMYTDGRIVVADNYFSKTKNNIENGSSKGAILFITQEGKAFQIKGDIEYQTEGSLYDFMKSWNPKEHPGNAAVAIANQEVYNGKTQIR
ncbi:MAG: pyridoxamine 5'-phosphate oxidase family protein [Spirochaetales bacterium]|nr:pyridoxamine 5'-phosphate oxidase family protein [Spirochaetales bacterium]